MPLPTLDSLTAGIDRVCADVLGESIQYKAKDAATFETVQASFVDYRDGAQELAGAQTVVQNIRAGVLMADVPAKPTRDVVIQLAKRPGLYFRPTNVVSDETGTGWEFDCEEVTLA